MYDDAVGRHTKTSFTNHPETQPRSETTIKKIKHPKHTDQLIKNEWNKMKKIIIIM